MDNVLLMLALSTTEVLIIRVGVKFIEMMFPLKNDYKSLHNHIMAIITEATQLFGLYVAQ